MFKLIPRNPFPHSLIEIYLALIGKNHNQFYKHLLNYLDVNNGILVGSGREALYLILKGTLKEGDEIIVPAFSCNVILGAIKKAGIKPVFSDVNLDSLNMELENFKNLVTYKTKAVLVTHQFGYPAEINPIIEHCKNKNILVIEDAAPALGAKYNGKYVGTFSDVAFFSFETSKVISTIEGGLIIGKDYILDKLKNSAFQPKNNSSLLYFIKSLKYWFTKNYFIYSILLNLWGLLHKNYSKADVLNLDLNTYSTNYRTLSKFQMSLGLLQLSNIDNIIYVRNEAAKLYRKELENCDQIISIPQSDLKNRIHTYSRFTILVKDKMLFYKAVKKQGVDLGFTFSYKLPQYFQNDSGEYPNTDFVIKHILNIPINMNMSFNEAIAQKLKIVLK